MQDCGGLFVLILLNCTSRNVFCLYIPFFFRTFARSFAYMHINPKVHILVLLLLLLPFSAWGQVVDSVAQEAVEQAGMEEIPLRKDTLPPPSDKSGLDAPVEYVAKESIVLLGTGSD